MRVGILFKFILVALSSAGVSRYYIYIYYLFFSTLPFIR